MRLHFWALIVFLLAGTGALAQTQSSAGQPRIVNAKMSTRSAAAGFEREFRAAVAAQQTAGWMGWAAPIVDGERQMCCWSSWENTSRCCGSCRLEREQTSGVSGTLVNGDRRVNLENQWLIVMARAERGNLTKLRTFSQECEIDAAGLPVTWLTEVNPAQSVALLGSLVRAAQWDRSLEGDDDRSIAKQAVGAIALHKDASADRELEQFIAPNQHEALRKQVAFWLGSARGRAGFALLQRMVREDPSDKVREQAVFGFHVSKLPEGIDAMIAVAKNDRSNYVRGQALFWLGQTAGKKATEAISSAIDNDPETAIKKKAVLALSQLPKDEGVPMLIQVAKTNKNPEVRKQAIFWLGQSKDPRALSFFEEVLRR